MSLVGDTTCVSRRRDSATAFCRICKGRRLFLSVPLQLTVAARLQTLHAKSLTGHTPLYMHKHCQALHLYYWALMEMHTGN